jgi:GT2 family glycosyltransferase
LGGSLSGRFRLGEYVTEPSVYEQAHRIGWGTGAMVAISRACLDDVGAWDERFFLYSEETDFMLRADAAGHEIWFEPAACVVHPGGESQTAPRLYALLVRNMVTATTKWRGRWAGAAMWVVRVLAELVRYPADRDRHGRALRALVRPQPWAVVQAGGVVRPPTG